MREVTGVILAGGKSSRMGTNKALLTVGGIPTIERVKDILISTCSQTVVVGNQEDLYRFLNVSFIKDHHSGKGPLAGIHAGLKWSTTDWNLVVACDMPLMNEEVVLGLIDQSNASSDVIIPRAGGRDQPLLALYRKSSLPIMEQALEENRLSLKHVLSHLKVKSVTFNDLNGVSERQWERAFFNMNRPDEYVRVKNIDPEG
ncbi:molybdenum cofactor guanylyltransferase [Alteribacter aurantiacus]|uniref:molybdenum cofactor guanylyltransferase n=1 Tax=Alteribacter aurantiacus TaxID=254410 RepID=UPI0003F9A4E1|nr:molybdenum cofactor guanylyltransferase [Alteribacter aurantiacus]